VITGFTESVIPSFNAWDVNDTWFVAFHLCKHLYNGSFRGLLKLAKASEKNIKEELTLAESLKIVGKSKL
jgi:hypothetical protein